MRKSTLLIILLVTWIILSNGLVLFFWKGTNLGDLVILERVKPLVCKLDEYKYRMPYSKIEKGDISEEDWTIYQKVGMELIRQDPCPEYKDYVWFNLIEESIDNTFEEFIKE